MEDFRLFIRLWLEMQPKPIGNELHFTCTKDAIPELILSKLVLDKSDEQVLMYGGNKLYITLV